MIVPGLNGIPDMHTLLPLSKDNCDVTSFKYTDRELKD